MAAIMGTGMRTITGMRTGTGTGTTMRMAMAAITTTMAKIPRPARC